MIKIDNYIQTTNRKQHNIPARPAGNFRVFPQLTTDYFVKQGENLFLPWLITSIAAKMLSKPYTF